MEQETTVRIPASKSVSHRALICAGLAEGTSRLVNVLRSADLVATRACLTAGDVEISEDDGGFVVRGRPQGLKGGTADAPVLLPVAESGTTCRLIAGVAAAGRGAFVIRGEGRMHDRPLDEIAVALHRLGPEFAWLEKPGCPPVRILTEGLSGGTTSITLEQSSQYLSGILLAAPLAKGPVAVAVTGEKAVSWPYVGLTLTAMSDFGVEPLVETLEDGGWKQADWRSLTRIEPGRVRFTVTPGRYQSRDYEVEGDWSSASYFLAAGALSHPVRVTGLRRDSLQADREVLAILKAMGADIAWNGHGVRVAPVPGMLRGVDVNMGQCPDVVPTIAVLAACAQGTTRITGVAHLRIKESDRLAALAAELVKVGAKVELLPDGIVIEPGTLPEGQEVAFSSHNDHRIAMSMALFGLHGIAVTLDNPGCVAKSFPTFWDEFGRVARRDV